MISKAFHRAASILIYRSGIPIILNHGDGREINLSGEEELLIRSWAYFNRTTSVWNGSPQSLRYAQLLFDLGGYHGRLIKSRVLKLGLLPPDSTTARSMLEANMFETDQELAVLRSKLEQELQSDDPARVLEKWEKKVHDWLKEVPAVEIRESGSGWRLGMFLGGEEKG